MKTTIETNVINDIRNEAESVIDAMSHLTTSQREAFYYMIKGAQIAANRRNTDKAS